MNYPYPHTATNKTGEKITFLNVEKVDGIDRLNVTNELQPGAGPPMHVHYKQDESITVLEGKMTYQVLNGDPITIGPDESVTFSKGTPHKFWNSGQGLLRCNGWVSPPNNVDFFITELYKATDAGSDGRPEPFASAFLMMYYKSEYGMLELPGIVRYVIIPMTYYFGKLTGKYRRFKYAPKPI